MTETSNHWQQFLETRSEEAFRVVVEKGLPVVYSAALRQVNGDAALAADVSQVVFAELAQKAERLPTNVYLAGWLYRHTCFTAAKMLRTESRRRAREKEAVLMNLEGDSPESTWEQVAPLLEEGMNTLGSADRDALLLRYFEGRDLRSVGAAIGASEDAAQKRISRALDKLRLFFSTKGVTVSGAALAALLTAHSSSAVPAGLAALVAGTAISSVVAAGSLPIWGTLMTMGKIKALTLGIAVVVGVATPVIFQQKTIARLQSENSALRDHLHQAASPVTTNGLPAWSPAELERMAAEHSELLRLRAETARLRTQQQELSRLQQENQRLKAAAGKPPSPANGDLVASSTWANVGFGSPLDALQTSHWAVRNADIPRFKQSILFTEPAKQFLTNLLAQMPGDALAEAKKQGYGLEEAMMFPMISQDRRIGYKGYRVLSQEAPAENEMLLNIQMELNSGKTEERQMRFQRFGNDWKYVLDVADFQRLMQPQETKR